MDLFNYQFVNESFTRLTTQVGVTLGLMIVLHAFANLFFTGGIISVLATDDGLFSWRRFWSGARAYFFRFFQLWVISFVPYAAVFLIYGVVLSLIAQSATTRNVRTRCSYCQMGCDGRFAACDRGHQYGF